MITDVPPAEKSLRLEKVTDAEIRRREVSECDPYRQHSTWEPSMTVHDVFSRHIPGAFGLGFFRRLIAASARPVSVAASATAGH